MGRSWTSTLLFLLLCCAPLAAQQMSAGLSEAQVATVERSQVLRQSRTITGTPLNTLARTVLQSLVSTPLATGMANHPSSYSVDLLSAKTVNAFAIGNGEVYVERGLMPYLGTVPGYWAAVLGHETGHNLAHHVYRNYKTQMVRNLALAALELKARSGGKASLIALLAANIGSNLLINKFSRNEENEADRLGLEMMVQAGYHPDFMLSIYRRLEMQMGNQGHVADLFSDHPRWDTREQREMEVYQQELAAFQKRWPDAAESPGGAPPPIGDLGVPTYQVDTTQQQIVLEIPFDVRNAAGETITVATMLPRKKQQNHAPDLEPDHRVGFRRDVADTAEAMNGTVELRLPIEDPRADHMTVWMSLLTPTDMLDLHSWQFDLKHAGKPREVR